jgi:1,4-alpha-glucan branching enzyme
MVGLMAGYLSIVLHAHLPLVRHPEHERFLEESWLFEAITETYLPLIQLLDGWERDGVNPHLTLSLSPTLTAMLLEPLLQHRYEQRLTSLIELAEKEVHRTHWEAAFRILAEMYLARFRDLHRLYVAQGRNLVAAFGEFQQRGLVEIIPCAASHAVLPLLAGHPPSIRAQVLVARDYYRACFGRGPRGFWLPECAYADVVEKPLQEANLRWFIVDTHGIANACPRPRFGVYAPVYTPNGLAVFGRDRDSAAQVWSRQEGYPGDPWYRDFYRDIGFDLDYDYLKPYLPMPDARGFTGLKYFRITGRAGEKSWYDRAAALQRVEEHARHFLAARRETIQQMASQMKYPPLLVAPYDAELLGHWWYEGPEFLDRVVRGAARDPETISLITPSECLHRQTTLQVAVPSASSWGQAGYWQVWLNETSAWIYPHLQAAQREMTVLAQRFPQADGLIRRALQMAAHELLLAQASDWPFILRSGSSPDYARRRIQDHLVRFRALAEQLSRPRIQLDWLATIEAHDRIFPEINYRYWA